MKNLDEILNQFGIRPWLWVLAWQKYTVPFRRQRYEPKIFCIGYQKTGTTSVGKALHVLGYSHGSYNEAVSIRYENKDYDYMVRYASRFESLDDYPWFKEDMIPLLDKTFPGSKFIYMERDEDKWAKSFQEWYVVKTGRTPDIAAERRKFVDHKTFVLDYFADRAGTDFASFNISDPTGMQKMARFLGRDTDLEAFPHLNKTSLKKRSARVKTKE